jgi:rfaE bifunctional protein nucleotidyltransferase chain/domain
MPSANWWRKSSLPDQKERRTPLFSSSEKKIHTLDTLLPALEKQRQAGRTIVFTNGCFDLLHAGHIEVLEEARSLGDFLVVAMNTDASVSRIKGPLRPIVPEGRRARVMAALEAVDAVILFDEPTPLELIVSTKPDVLVKGGDWDVSSIVGAPFILERGGEVLSIPLIPDSSTTGLVEMIIKKYGHCP